MDIAARRAIALGRRRSCFGPCAGDPFKYLAVLGLDGYRELLGTPPDRVMGPQW